MQMARPGRPAPSPARAVPSRLLTRREIVLSTKSISLRRRPRTMTTVFKHKTSSGADRPAAKAPAGGGRRARGGRREAAAALVITCSKTNATYN
ncbi:hypothetical protein EVAR_102420_1 [Eumeta japonica]|uniref:Uncharacterized protein n=1 Tax=Eumeta variegata TaxID=151549 RepID=A0A4C1YYZ4_EUMVA|nr:hypothetical protein EVAR_102420_1 [Eumeta japonica]